MSSFSSSDEEVETLEFREKIDSLWYQVEQRFMIQHRMILLDLLIPIVLSFINYQLVPSGIFPFFCVFPWCFQMYSSLAPDIPNSRILTCIIYTSINIIILFVFYKLLNIISLYFLPFEIFIRFEFCLLWIYSPCFIIHNINENIKNSIVYRYYILLFWDIPMLFAFYFNKKYRNNECCSPSISIINKDISIGSLCMFNKCILDLYKYPNNVRAIINCCNEMNWNIRYNYNIFSYPNGAIKNLNIKYLHLPIVETCQPKLKDIIKACEFIQTFVENYDKKNINHARIHIHSKCGQSRCVCIAVCWMIYYHSMDRDTAIKYICGKRQNVNKYVAKYRVVKQFEHYCKTKKITITKTSDKN